MSLFFQEFLFPFPFLFNPFFLFLLFLYASSVRNCTVYLKVMRHCEVSVIPNVIPDGSNQRITHTLSYFMNLNQCFLRLHVICEFT